MTKPQPARAAPFAKIEFPRKQKNSGWPPLRLPPLLKLFGFSAAGQSPSRHVTSIAKVAKAIASPELPSPATDIFRYRDNFEFSLYVHRVDGDALLDANRAMRTTQFGYSKLKYTLQFACCREISRKFRRKKRIFALPINYFPSPRAASHGPRHNASAPPRRPRSPPHNPCSCTTPAETSISAYPHHAVPPPAPS